MSASKAEFLASLTASQRRKIFDGFTDREIRALEYDWRFWARPKQLAPDGDWSTWVLRAGRGFGKTRAGSGWFHSRAMAFPGRWMALIARTPADARDYCVEGPGGLLRNAPPHEMPQYEPSKRRITWPNGSWATIYSGDEPDQTRGFSGDTAWFDEFAKFRHAKECWDNVQFGMRETSSDKPRKLITSTPRPLPILRTIEGMESTVVVCGSSYENRGNLDQSWFAQSISIYEGTRIGRQEIHAEILEDAPGALWQIDAMDRLRVAKAPDLVRVVVGVDPSGTSGDDGRNSVGIVAVGKGVDGHGYVLADRTCSLSPAGWGRRVYETMKACNADRVVAEVNFGGAMVEHVIRTIDPDAPYKSVTASRGKVTRAEPIAALYEQGRFHHVGAFPDLEDQMYNITPNGYVGDGSPDRVDALVWAATELMDGVMIDVTNVSIAAVPKKSNFI